MASDNLENSQKGNDETLITPEALMATMKEMVHLISQHQEEISKQYEGQQNNITPPPLQFETSSKVTGETAIQKLSKFKKFAPRTFKEAVVPNDAEEWLEELEAVLEALRTEEEDKMIFTEFLLQGEARMWWKMEKEKKVDGDHLWKEFQELFLRRYFPISVHERKRKEFMYLVQGTKTIMEYD